MTVNYDLIREEELCFFFFQKKRQIMLTWIFIRWLNKQRESASKKA